MRPAVLWPCQQTLLVSVVGREPQARSVQGAGVLLNTLRSTGCPHIKGVFGPRHLWVLPRCNTCEPGKSGSRVLSPVMWQALVCPAQRWHRAVSSVGAGISGGWGGGRLWPQPFHGSLTFFCPSLDFCQAFFVWVQCPMTPSSSVTRQKAWGLRGRSLQ